MKQLFTTAEAVELARYSTIDETTAAVEVAKAAAQVDDLPDSFWIAAVFHAGIIQGQRMERQRKSQK